MTARDAGRKRGLSPITRRAKAEQDLKNCADETCKQQAQAEIDKWDVIDASRDAEYNAACGGGLSGTAGCADATRKMYETLGSFASVDARNAASDDKTGAITLAHKEEMQSYLDLIKTANPEIRTSTESKVRDPSEYDSDAYGVITPIWS